MAEPFFNREWVETGGDERIQTRLETLIHSKCQKPYDWYKELDMDKSLASKIRRGKLIPPRWMRIKIAHYFEVDSAAIWFLPEEEANLFFEQIKGGVKDGS